MRILLATIALLFAIGISAEAAGIDAGPPRDAGAADAATAPATAIADPVTDTGSFLSQAFRAVQEDGWGIVPAAILVIGLLGALKWLMQKRGWGLAEEIKGNYARVAVFLIASLGAVAHAAAVEKPIDWQLIQTAITVGVAAIAGHTVKNKVKKTPGK